MNQYKAAIVGLGNIAWRFDSKTKLSHSPLTHAESYRLDNRVVLVGGCSVNLGDRTEFTERYSIPAFGSIEELIDKTEPDIVSICSHSDFHFEHLLYCLDRNISMIWLEKPPTSTLDELDALIEKKQHLKSKILVNYIRRYCRPYQNLKKMYIEDLLGETVFLNMSYSRGLSLNGSHIIDTAFFVLGDNNEAFPELATLSSDSDNPSFFLRFSNGLLAFVSGLSLEYHNIDISLTCDRGRASITHGGIDTLWERKAEHELFPGFFRLKKDENDFLGQGGFDGCMAAAVNDLIQSYEDEREPASNLETSRNTQKVIESINNQLRNTR